MKQQKIRVDEPQARAFQHGFVVGFMNGARTITEAFRAALEGAIETTLEQNKATEVYLSHSCRNPVCLNFRPESTTYCGPECEATERAWHARPLSSSAMVH